MDIQALKLFVDTADLRSFTKAAEANYVTQPALSRKIAELEASCGFALLDRAVRPIGLTEDGRAVYAKAVELLRHDAELDELVSSLRLGGGLSLRVAYVMAGHQPLLTRALKILARRWPEADLSAQRAFAPEGFRLLGDGKVDAIVCNTPEQEGHLGVSWRAVAPCGLVAFIPSGHALSGKASVRLRDLAGEPLTTLARFGSPTMFDTMKRRCREAGFEPDFSHMAPDTSTFSMLLSLHGDIGFMPSTTAVADLEGYAAVPIEDAEGFDVTLVWRADDGRSAMGALADALAQAAAPA